MHYIDHSNTQNLIKKKRVIFSYDSFFDRIFSNVFALFLSIPTGMGAFLYLKTSIEKSENPTYPILFFLVFLLFIVSIIFLQINTKKLTRIKGVNRSTNRKTIKNLANTLQWQLIKHSQDLSILHKPVTFSSLDWGKNLYIIYDNNDILICCISFGKYDVVSPFHWFSNKRIVNLVKKEFIKLN